MSYASLTFQDKNKIKRYLQNHRLQTAIGLAAAILNQGNMTVCDYGAGNGELCKLIQQNYPDCQFLCYEPTPDLLAEAKENLKTIPKVSFFQDETEMTDGTADVVFCLEVFEHLPEAETRYALNRIENLLHTNGIAIIGVPVEIGLPALYKGIFRIWRRYGAYDATVKHVLLSACGFPPQDRPCSEIAPGFHFYQEHTGFDFRKLREQLEEQFTLKAIKTSPCSLLGSWVNPEINFVIAKRK